MLTPELNPYLNWLSQHPMLAGLLTGIICFLECLAGIGVIIPGTVLMTALGALLGTGTLSWMPTMLWAIVGTLLGSGFSFWLGYHYRQTLRDNRLFRRYPQLLPRGDAFFQRYGIASIFIGRFAGPMRAILPMIAGMNSMRISHFLIADISSGLLWPAFYMLPGILLGQASQALSPIMLNHWLPLATALLLLLGLLLIVLKPMILAYSRWIARRQLSPLTAGCFLLSTLLFCLLTWSVLQTGLLTRWNATVYHWMCTIRDPLLGQWMRTITRVDTSVMGAMGVAVTGWLLIKRQYRTTAYWIILGISVVGLCQVFKSLVRYPRPSGMMQPLLSYAFPSGHLLANTALLGALLVLSCATAHKVTRSKALSYGLLMVWIGLMMFSRMYLAAHWLSDVIGGALLGFSCASLFSLYYRKYCSPLPQPRSLVLTALLTVLVGWGINIFFKNACTALLNSVPYLKGLL